MPQAPHAPATPSAGTTTAPDRTAADRDWAVLELEMLCDLARIGTDIAERVNQQHAAAVAATPPGAARAALHRDVAQAFMRIARAVRLTLAMFGRVREVREALAAGTVLPAAPVMPEGPKPSAGAGQCAAAETARALARNPGELGRDIEAEGDKRDDENVGGGPAPAKRAHGSNRPDRESLTELADFGFSLKHCSPGEVIARIYRDLGLPPDPARWPQARPAPRGSQAGVPDPDRSPAKASRSKSTMLPRPATRGEGPALAVGKSPRPGGASSPVALREPGFSRKRDLLRTAFHPSAVIPAKAGISCRSERYEIPAFAGMTNREIVKSPRDPRIKSERESQQDAGLLPSDSSMPPEDTS